MPPNLVGLCSEGKVDRHYNELLTMSAYEHAQYIVEPSVMDYEAR